MLELLGIEMVKDLFVQFLGSVQVLFFSRICTFANLGQPLYLCPFIAANVHLPSVIPYLIFNCTSVFFSIILALLLSVRMCPTKQSLFLRTN